jgi:cellulose biosynthesis protein BcsQ
MRQLVTLYNNKGGVSKTTTLFNLGVYLATKQNQKVLLVDCDPQCNLTELFFASTDLLDDLDRALPGTSVYEALVPRFRGEGARVDAGPIGLTQSRLYPSLYLFRGDFELSMAESYLASAINMAITENIHEKNTYIALYRLFRDLLDRDNFDFVLVDVGPSTGALTRLSFLSCDAFLIPTTPDRFCNQAVAVLATVISDWLKRHNEVVRTFEPFGLETFPGSPTFLGAISQNFKAWGGKAKQSYQKWERTIGKTLRERFVKTAGVPQGRSFDPNAPYVTNIQDVGTLAPVAQMFGRAIFDIQPEHSAEASTTGNRYYGVVWDNWVERMSEYQGKLEEIAEVVKNA